MPSTRKRSAMLYRRARSGLVLIGVFWLWMLFGAADLVGALFGSPVHAALAVFALGALTLISLLFLPICVAYLVLNRSAMKAPGKPANAAERHEGTAPAAGLAPVIRMMPRRAAERGAELTGRAAAKWRDLAS
ncbi:MULTISPECIES: hypothetical protein [unclassified Arthrobacter]|uniref:hypothetical protein n=1 Tax=unclassified Arthrobacter TaxID=235627 RepID=UPI001D14EDC5|nr:MULTISPECIES: hypothetical protein [unclassified Arthrobacter]MCC3275272.1 hypothetical protein [Arthrobacter sp. zg-Y20]MCC3278347.1 hypothetical protein [Arthrobacter sp. zg-Y40]MCC9176718.1 hypothetical protein [Arthrobacter sp. zg-Y750]MDK1315429.1 hypothetical protein [Arthrobacter sp. zg.Y20]MDK1326578.1 hypothetical protein [Arthrobacter sp. zg-Y1143]